MFLTKFQFTSLVGNSVIGKKNMKLMFSDSWIFLLLVTSCSYLRFSNAARANNDSVLPAVIQTWHWSQASEKAWQVMFDEKRSALDAVEEGCTVCEDPNDCGSSVGMGGSPDEHGETTLDAMIMDGVSHRVGSVGCLRGVKSAIAVARAVMQYTKHTLLVGELAANFALEMGFHYTNLSTNSSVAAFEKWKAGNCQPNARINVHPDPTKNCGPYSPNKMADARRLLKNGRLDSRWPNSFNKENHDTIGMVAVDLKGNIAGGTSTNGAGHKVPGRVGDSPITGAGSYVDQDVGGAAATGNGDVMMRYLPTYQAVESMRAGKTPMQAAREAINRIANKEKAKWSGALIVMNMKGEQGASCFGINTFHYCYRNATSQQVDILQVKCVDA